jgi:hypothetical protein
MLGSHGDHVRDEVEQREHRPFGVLGVARMTQHVVFPLQERLHLLDREVEQVLQKDDLREPSGELANELGQEVAYKLMPGATVPPMLQPGSAIYERARFVQHNLWVTAYDADEKYAAGNYPYQSPDAHGLPEYAENDAPIANAVVVLWYTVGAHHVVRPEDWRVMPVAYAGFHLRPVGFFDGNPALDCRARRPAMSTLPTHAIDAGVPVAGERLRHPIGCGCHQVKPGQFSGIHAWRLSVPASLTSKPASDSVQRLFPTTSAREMPWS